VITALTANEIARAGNPEVQRRTLEIVELARQCAPDNVGEYLVGVGIGLQVSAGKNDAHVLDCVRHALGKIRSYIQQVAQSEGSA